MNYHTTVYIEDKDAPPEKAIHVHTEYEETGTYETVMREASREEVLAKLAEGFPVYVRVKGEDLVYPYAKYDFEESPPSAESARQCAEFCEMLGQEWKFEKTYFQSAAMVFIPQMGLI